MSATEQAVVDKGRDTSTWNAIHSAYESAVIERSQAAATQSAVTQLGLDSLQLGVVP